MKSEINFRKKRVLKLIIILTSQIILLRIFGLSTIDNNWDHCERKWLSTTHDENNFFYFGGNRFLKKYVLTINHTHIKKMSFFVKYFIVFVSWSPFLKYNLYKKGEKCSQ